MMFLAKWIDFAAYAEMFEKEMSVLTFDLDRAVSALTHMGIGMLVIFVIIGVIIMCTALINKLFSNKK